MNQLVPAFKALDMLANLEAQIVLNGNIESSATY